MTIKEESSFLQKVESRLDSIFAEDKQLIKEKDFDAPPAVVEEVSIHVKQKNIGEAFDLEETNRATEVSLDELQTQDKSAFISEIEKRFSAIFGDDDHLVVAGRAHFRRGEQSLDYRFVEVHTLLDGKVTERRAFMDAVPEDVATFFNG